MQAEIHGGRLVIDSIANADEAAAALKIALAAGLTSSSTVDLGEGVGLRMLFDVPDGWATDGLAALLMIVAAINSNGVADPVRVLQRVAQDQPTLVEALQLVQMALVA